MKIQTKTFLIFQITMAIVTTLLMSIYWLIFAYVTKESLDIIGSVMISLFFVFAFAIIIFPVWRLWKGKTWYSLSLFFFSAITIIAILSFAISLMDTHQWGFSLFWGMIILYMFAFPANLFISCLTGLIGKYIYIKYNNKAS